MYVTVCSVYGNRLQCMMDLSNIVPFLYVVSVFLFCAMSGGVCVVMENAFILFTIGTEWFANHAHHHFSLNKIFIQILTFRIVKYTILERL